jgi:hypothetical protein
MSLLPFPSSSHTKILTHSQDLGERKTERKNPFNCYSCAGGEEKDGNGCCSHTSEWRMCVPFIFSDNYKIMFLSLERLTAAVFRGREYCTYGREEGHFISNIC